MTTTTNNATIPLVYAYLYMKIKIQMKGDRISGSDLRKIIQKVLLCDKGKGIKGLPGRYCYDIIKDLVDFGLIEKMGKIGNNPVYKSNDDKITEVAGRLNYWKISKKLRESKNVNKKLKCALKILDEDPLYRVVKSKCDKALKQAFW